MLKIEQFHDKAKAAMTGDETAMYEIIMDRYTRADKMHEKSQKVIKFLEAIEKEMQRPRDTAHQLPAWRGILLRCIEILNEKI